MEWLRRASTTTKAFLAVGALLILLVAVVAFTGGEGDDEPVAATASTSTAPDGTTTTLVFGAPPPQAPGTPAPKPTEPNTTPPDATTTSSEPPDTTPSTTPPRPGRPGPTISTEAGDHAALRSALADARRQWAERDFAAYVFRTSRTCFCPFADNEISVDASGAVDGQRSISGEPEPSPPTIAEVFAAIADAIADDAAGITVSFEVDLGYPVELSIDYSEQIADDEIGRSIRWVVPR